MTVSTVQISIVVPAFNEAANIESTINRLRAYLDGEQLSWEIIVVDDGSRDATVALVRAMAARDPRVRITLGSRRGKGAAVRRGMLEAHGAWRFMADADLSMPPDNIGRFFAVMRESPTTDILIGSREAAGAQRIGEPWRRHAAGRLFNYLTQALGVRGIRDTQCGFKLFHGAVAHDLFSRMRVRGFSFDVEVLMMAQRRGYRIAEVPVPWQYGTETKVSPIRDSWRNLHDVLTVRWFALRGRYQGLDAPLPLSSVEKTMHR